MPLRYEKRLWNPASMPPRKPHPVFLPSILHPLWPLLSNHHCSVSTFSAAFIDQTMVIQLIGCPRLTVVISRSFVARVSDQFCQIMETMRASTIMISLVAPDDCGHPSSLTQVSPTTTTRIGCVPARSVALFFAGRATKNFAWAIAIV